MDREQLQRDHGICSMRDCDEPIIGWCDTCNAGGPFRAPKLCPRHLLHHCADMLPAHHYPHLIPEVQS